MNVKKHLRKLTKKMLKIDDTSDILFVYYCFRTDFYAKNIGRQMKVAYISCCIVFKMNSCEFARSTFIDDRHSTTRLFVRNVRTYSKVSKRKANEERKRRESNGNNNNYYTKRSNLLESNTTRKNMLLLDL